VSSQLGELNNATIQTAIDNQQRFININKLHSGLSSDLDCVLINTTNAATCKHANELSNIKTVLECVNNLMSNPNDSIVKLNLKNCDDSMTNVVVNHGLGSNQSMITMAKEYLKVRGIQ